MTERTQVARHAEDLDQPDSRHALIWFLVIEHPQLSPPIRVVADWLGYTIGGVEYLPAPFEVLPLTDSDQTPTAEIRVQAIDRRISEALEGDASGVRATVSAFAHSTEDFDLSVDPRVPLDEDDVPRVYSFQRFELADVRGDVIALTGRITLVDTTQEPWPFIRATSDRFPGLFA